MLQGWLLVRASEGEGRKARAVAHGSPCVRRLVEFGRDKRKGGAF